jgi:hypothetical protein
MSYSDLVLTNSPINYFRFNNGTIDSAGSVTPTVTAGSGVSYITSGGIQDTGYAFSNTNVLANQGFSWSGGVGSATPFSGKNFTVEFWANIDKANITSNANLFDGRGPHCLFYIPTASSGSIKLALYGNSTQKYLISTVGSVDSSSYSVPDSFFGKWSHIALVANGTTFKVYINGTEILSTSLPSTISTDLDTATRYLVKDNNPSTLGVEQLDYAKVDEFALYNAALSSTDITNRYLARTAAPALTASSLMQDPLVRTNNLVAQALSDNAVYVFPLDSVLTDAQGVAMTGGRSFSNPAIGQAVFRAGRSATGGVGSWEIPDTNTVGNEIQFVESTTPVIAREKGLTIEAVFYYPAYAANDTGRRDILIKNWSGSGFGFTLEGNSGTNYVNAGFSNNGYVQHPTALVPGSWYHMVARWDATDDYTYLTLNNSTVTSPGKNNGTGNHFDNSTYFNLGADSGLSLDYLAFYSEQYNSTKLTSTTLTNHYNAFEAARYIQQSKNINADAMTAYAMIPKAGQINATALTAFATIVNPYSIITTRAKNINATPLTASGIFLDGSVTLGANYGAHTLFAAADMGQDSHSLILGIANGNAMISTALMANPAVSTEKGALIKPQSLNANAQFPLPPAYYLITDDRWYKRLLDVDYQSANYNGVITFFNTNSNIYLGGGYGGWNAQLNRNAFNPYYGYNMTDSPVPVATAGGFDPVFRKTLKLRNIALAYSDAITYSQDWSFETMIKTTKSNQIIAGGYYLGDTSSSTSRSYRTGIRLKDGKLALISAKDTTKGFLNSTDEIGFTGFKNVADGEWHHVIIQYRASGVDATQPRMQIFIDGQLDIQRYGYVAYVPNQIGFNSTDVNAYSDFELSAVSVNKASFVLERETHLNYYAAVGIIPFEATTANASAILTQNNKGRGNRGRALMLYFWDTFSPTQNNYVSYYGGGPAGKLKTSTTLFDQGAPGSDPDSFYQLNTWIDNAPNKFYDWDIWPCPVVRFPSGESYIGDSHPILKDGITKSGTKNGTVYVDPITDDYRYLDIMNDLKDLDQFDMICFRNYPDNDGERVGYGLTAAGIADPYFNTLDKNLFQDFLDSLREAVDSGISLLITNPQLAIDLGFIEGYSQISDLGQSSDNTYSAKIATDPYNTGHFSPLNYVTYESSTNRNNQWTDTHKNNRHKVVNEVENLTTDPGYVWDNLLQYTVDGLEYGETGRVFNHIEYKPKLSIGDTFMTSDFRLSSSTYLAVPFDKVKAGTIITSFADTYLQDGTPVTNPYKNYATSIAVQPGTVVSGKQIGAKVFISFTDGVGVQKDSDGYLPFGNIGPIDSAMIELKTDAWIDYAYNLGSITAGERDEYKANPNNLDRQLAAGKINQETYNAKAYWQLDGQDLLGQANAYGGGTVDLTDTADGVTKGKITGRTRAGRRNTITSTSSLPAYTVQWSWLYPTAYVDTPSINTRGLWWLSQRLAYDTLPQRPAAITASAAMPNPAVSAYKPLTINAQAMVASGNIVDVTVNNTQPTVRSIITTSLPLTATAKIVGLGKTVLAKVGTANAKLATNIATYTVELDNVILYIMHEDPILYIREDK